MSEHLTVVVIDDHPLFREGVALTLRAENIEVVGQGETAEEAVRLTTELLPDIVLLDIDIPGGGLTAAQTIANCCPVSRIVILTGSEDEDNLLAALRTGSRAYVLKGVAARELVRILRGVAAGESYVTPNLAAGLLLELTGKAPGGRLPTSPLDELNERERVILEHVAAGASNKEIAYQLHLSDKTVKHYVTNILQKLQVRNRVEAAILAQKTLGTGNR
jgi:DNA-binding NarL/FixJ family response regulator